MCTVSIIISVNLLIDIANFPLELLSEQTEDCCGTEGFNIAVSARNGALTLVKYILVLYKCQLQE
jgi:hypothetical protein